ncbi:MAG: hypothetical protein AVDCRST_MAG77-4940 [uncultured Chloroflexi bacterium]|uniref:Uncharacterized protein n=1 Tax=uncultured Chloroflexota bacterium TaxID=166587 RepID=A0A6J4K227_9CHLR|nr:MAG: hypothetical protein AVDCRST_MAG77-4940 [uncultured Chloroflexota bacterium]
MNRTVIAWGASLRCARCRRFTGYRSNAHGDGKSWCDRCAQALDDARRGI